jgi:hypothetical protein
MKKSVSSLLLGYGGLMAVFGLLTQRYAPGFAPPALLAGVVGGGLSVFWGALGFIGRSRRGWAIATLAVTGFVLLTQAVTHWMPAGDPKPGTRTLAWLATVMLLATLGTLLVVAHAGAPAPSPGRGGSGSEAPEHGDARHSAGMESADAWKDARRRRDAGPTAKPR